MPIDYASLIAPFRTAYFLQRRSISESLRKIAEWLTKRLKETREREQATRGFQVFYFSGDALSVWIDTSQRGALGPEGEPPPTGFLQSAAAPFVALWNGLLLADTMIKSEGVLPGIIDTLSRTVKMIVDSLDRFKTPDKSLFDPKVEKSWKDLFGEVGLFFRVINDPATVKQVETFTTGGWNLKYVLSKHFPSKPEEEQKAGGGLADIPRLIIGGILVMPLAGRLLAQIGQTADKVVRLKLLDWAASIQNQVFDLRREAIDFLYVTLFDIGRQALEWLVMMQFEVVPALNLYGSFIKVFFGEVETWLKTTGKELKTFTDSLIRFLRGLGDYLETFMVVDFGKAVSFGFISFTLKEILEWRDDPSKAQKLQTKIDDLLEDRPILTALLRDRLLALRQIIGIAATKTNFPAEAAPPDLTGIGFPNLSTAFFGGKEAADLRSSLADTGSNFKTNVGNIFDAGITLFTELGDEMDKAGTAAARLGSAARYTQVADRASTLAETAFGAKAMRARLAERKDPIAAAFESWLIESGFNLVGKALPKYVAEMIEFWKVEAAKTSAERPTSPHILARREQVNRVRMPRMIIRVNDERELDKVLAAEIADRVHAGVSKAFQLAVAKHQASG